MIDIQTILEQAENAAKILKAQRNQLDHYPLNDAVRIIRLIDSQRHLLVWRMPLDSLSKLYILQPILLNDVSRYTFPCIRAIAYITQIVYPNFCCVEPTGR